VLPIGTIAAFGPGLAWSSTYALDTTRGERWWLQAVADAEHRGLIEWDRTRKVWTLTDDGRAQVRGVS
jgi:hypothetical protein